MPAAPKDALEALEQRRAKYLEASAQAKAGGDDRKARMHERIAKVLNFTPRFLSHSKTQCMCHVHLRFLLHNIKNTCYI